MSEENVACPVCEKTFLDMRGLTSHARHKHDLSSEGLAELLQGNHVPGETKIPEIPYLWKVIGGVGIVTLAALLIKKLR